MTLKTVNNRGGKRANAGRKVGSGKFSEPTTVMRVPVSHKESVADFVGSLARKQASVFLKANIDAVATFELPTSQLSALKRPLFNSKVPAGFPSPADDHVEKRLDPNEYLIEQEDATFFVTIQGESMIDVGLMPGDKAIINRAKLAKVGDIVLAVIDGEFTIKTLARRKDGHPRLLPANGSGKYAPIEITEAMQFEVWGVVTGSFRRFK
jgi:DNA polymerase V